MNLIINLLNKKIDSREGFEHGNFDSTHTSSVRLKPLGHLSQTSYI